ncbi:hypothetical protein G8764_05160 [Pseudomaricurvus alcaniphilus]|uniref:type II secretion system protein GspL n=1 Tax=Pseudomaricurvus alcaniphilus TaxID=1166482 RepID=UPI00140A26B4|nr:hypothetical protein [Pseudomaricurvus alcaniphilus]
MFVIRVLEQEDGTIGYACCLLAEQRASAWQWCETAAELQARAAQSEYDAVGLILPGQRVGRGGLTLSRAELRHLASLAPFQLEDELAGSVDELHFAYSIPERGEAGYRVEAYWVDRDWLRARYDELEALGFEISHCWADFDLLDGAAGNCWTLQLDGNVLVHPAGSQAFALDLSMAPVVLEKMVAAQVSQGIELPESLHLLAPDDRGLQALTGCVPNILRSLPVESELQPLRLSTALLSRARDLARGDFAKMLPFGRWWQQWRAVSVLAGVAVALYLAVGLVQVADLQAQQQQVRSAIESSYRQAVPRGAMVDPEKQLRQKVRGSGNQGERSYFLPMMAFVGPILNEHQQVRVASLNYQSNKHELRLSIESESFADIEALRARLNARGYRAELTSSSSRQQKHLAQLQIVRTAGV